MTLREITYKSDIDVTLVQMMGGDYMVVAAARVSTSGEDCLQYIDPASAAENAGVIRYLMQHRHGTPFEHAGMTFYVRAPIFVWREWHRHRIGISYNEESGRYKELAPVFYLPDRERPMMKVGDEKTPWKPGRPKFTRCESDDVYNNLCTNLKHSYSVGYEMYQANLALNIDPGLARDCLPVGIFSGCWVSLNPRSMMHFLSLRTHHLDAKFVSYPLWEIAVAAEMVEKIFAEHWPITYKAFNDMGRVAP